MNLYAEYMPKKVNNALKKKRGLLFYTTRYFLFFSVALLFFAGTKAYLSWQDRPITCANSKSCTSDLTQHVDNNAIGMFEGKKVIPPKIDASQQITYQPVLGANTDRKSVV